MLVSIAITTHNEVDEFKKLLNLLSLQLKNVQYQYEIVVVDDNSTVAGMNEVFDANRGIISVYQHKLDGDFATHKNYLKNLCKGDVIFNIDADEIPAEYLTHNIESFFAMNPDVDVFNVPRVNTVSGLTERHVKMWGWTISSTPLLKKTERINMESPVYDFLVARDLVSKQSADNNGNGIVELEYRIPIINFPDYQMRLWRNVPTIKWEGRVHEVLTGHKKIGALPMAMEYALKHDKSIQKQEFQNEMYSRMIR